MSGPRPEIATFLATLAAEGGPSVSNLGVGRARQMMTDLIEWWGEPDPVDTVIDTVVDGRDAIPVRVYRPAPGVLPVIAFFHGGGWVIGDLDTHDGACRALAIAARCVVVSVNYRRAPEHPFPAAPDDCMTAVRWIAARAERLGIDAGRLSVAGDSAGANLAAAVAQECRDAGIAISSQALIYPVTDLTIECSTMPYPEGYLLTAADMAWYYDHYATPADRLDVRASPMRAASLRGLAPAYVVTCELDPLRPQGAEYVRRLREADVAVVHDDLVGMIHGFATMRAITPAADELWRSVADHARATWLSDR